MNISLNEDYTGNQNGDNKKIKAPPGIILQSEFFSDPRTIKLSDEHGPIAVLILLNIWTVLNDSDNGIISLDLVSKIGRQFGSTEKKIKAIIETSITLKLLYTEADYIYHNKIIERRRAFAQKQSNYSTARIKRIREEKSLDSSRIQVEFTENPQPLLIDHTHTQYLDQININKDPKIEKPPKAKQPKFNPDGKTKLLDWVFIEPEKIPRLKSFYLANGLEPEWFDYAVRALDKWFADNQKMREIRLSDAKTLAGGWPFKEAIKAKTDALRMKRAEMNIATKPQPKSASHKEFKPNYEVQT